jgi:hypothetical protein
MAKNTLLECVHPLKAIEFLMYASQISRNRLFCDVGITCTSGYNSLKSGRTISSSNWYNLVARLPDNMYSMYLKLITRVHKDTVLQGTISYDPFLFYTKRENSPHPVNDVLIYLTNVYNLSLNEIATQTEIKSDLLRLYLIHGSQEPRLDRLRLILSSFPLNVVYEFEWFMRNVHQQTPLTDFKYIRSIV